MGDWTPSTFEDRLLDEHFDTVPGTAYVELPISLSGEPGRARRIDAVLIPGGKRQVHPQGSYSAEEAAEAIRGSVVHVIEAKYALNRSVIGQVMVAKHLIKEAMNPASVTMVVVHAHDSLDLREFCEVNGIRVEEYAVGEPEPSPEPPGYDPFDVRRPPDEARRRAFLSGWTRAVNGELFGSIHKRKTHTNMGNLFGWIYGDAPEAFRLETWRRYVDNLMTRDTRR